MNKIPGHQGHLFDQTQEERLWRCAQLVHVVPINKKLCREHLEAMADQLRREARGEQ